MRTHLTAPLRQASETVDWLLVTMRPCRHAMTAIRWHGNSIRVVVPVHVLVKITADTLWLPVSKESNSFIGGQSSRDTDDWAKCGIHERYLVGIHVATPLGANSPPV